MKRIVALFSAVLMVLFAVPSMVLAEETTTLTITADKTVAKPGDRVTFSLMLGKVNYLGGITLYLDLPEGLSVDYSSVVLPEGVKETLDSDGDIIIPTAINENTFVYSAQRTGYTGSEDLCILKFTCTVNSDSSLEAKSVGLKDVDVFDNTPQLNTIQTTVNAAQLKVEEAKAPATTATPEPATTATPEPATTATPEPATTATPEPAVTATPEPAATTTAKPVEEPEVSRPYLSDLDELIEEVEPGTTIRIYKEDGIISLNRDILRTLNECGVSLDMEYTYEGKDYKIFIPAGKAVIDDDVFWCGPLYLAGMYGNNSTGLGALSQITHEIGQAIKQIIDLNP